MGQQADSSIRHLTDLMARFDNAMLVTHSESAPAGLHGRPMSIADVGQTGDIWFLTSTDSAKTQELAYNNEVLVTLQGPSTHVVVQGAVQIVFDRKKIDEIWHESFKIWFPEGSSDPTITLLRVRVQSAEFWDMKTANRVRYVWEATKAYLTQQPLEEVSGMHGVVTPDIINNDKVTTTASRR